MVLKRIIFIVGPTAVGKTDVAFLLAKKINGEIISCDSMQVYKEVNIASNKPSKEILKQAPHHLINVVSVSENFDVAIFRKKALEIIKKIHRKGKIPIIAGGSGLYMSVLLDGIFAKAAKDSALRRKLEKQAAEKGSSFLHDRLKKVDTQAALKIHPNDTKRIIRALEVFILKKKPISELQKKREGIWGQYHIDIFALNRNRDELYENINARTDQMFAAGLIDEIKKILKRKLSQTAQSIIGIKEIKEFLSGEYDLQRTKYLIKLNTRHFAKRQLTWFRRDKRLKWITLEKNMPVSKAVALILKELKIHG